MPQLPLTAGGDGCRVGGMSGKKAKRIRRLVYGDGSKSAKERRYVVLASGQVVAIGLRRAYRDAKKAARR